MGQNEEKLQRILDKLRKLMDLQSSARSIGNEGEANAAAAGISRLLKEYDLTLEDIPAEARPQNPVDLEEIPYRFNYMRHPWYWNMIETLALFNGCKTFKTQKFTEGHWNDCYELAGRKRNREVVLYLISFLGHKFLSIGREKYKSYKLDCLIKNGRTPCTADGFMKNFLLGCVVGLYHKLEEEKQSMPAEKTTALAMVHSNEIKQFIQNLGIEVNTARHRKIIADKEVVDKGYIVGRNIEINQGLSDTQKKKNQYSIN